MFYQEYITNSAKYLSRINFINNEKYLQSKVAYYINGTIPKLYVKGNNGRYELAENTKVFYNPLNNATLYTDEECSEKFSDTNITIYQINNLLDGKTASKVQAEFFETNTAFSSHSAILINANMITGYKKTNDAATNIYSFETLDDIVTKIRYLGVIPNSLGQNEFIILNYYTED